ncbi:hypothetical protein BH11PAT4_BH11PAT4_7630 [soil metagenome]
MYYYLSVLWPIAFYMVFFVLFFSTTNPDLLVSQFDHALFYSKFLWFTGAIVALTNLIGLLMFGSPRRKDISAQSRLASVGGWSPAKRLIVTYVSRGDNFKALDRSIKESGKVLAAHDVDYRIDVITDMPVEGKIVAQFNTHFHVTPSDYVTTQETKYKARALHYMVEQRQSASHHSQEHQDVWVLHLDEESVVTPSLITGIHEFITNPANQRVIGQGEIQYNAYKYGSNWFTVAADAIRTGDDLGRFRFQYKLFKKPVFGMHGSFVLVSQAIEREIGFDLLPKQSITEDAYFAFKAADRGIAFNWVEGAVREQSPFSVKEIILQRRRWFCGLWYLAFDTEISLKTRGMLMLNMLLWLFAWAGPIVAVVNLLAGPSYFPFWATVAAAVLQGAYVGIYMVGAYRNLIGAHVSWYKKLWLYMLTFILVPIVNLIEGVAVLYAIVKPVSGFHVVKKN